MCQQRSNGAMIQCSKCLSWYHMACVSTTNESGEEPVQPVIEPTDKHDEEKNIRTPKEKTEKLLKDFKRKRNVDERDFTDFLNSVTHYQI